jgi:hypothetical protein
LVKVVVVIVLITSSVFTQEKSNGKLYGSVFGDYFYKLGGDTVGGTNGMQYNTQVPKHFNAFQLRRFNLGYEHKISDELNAILLLEGNDKVIESQGRHGVFIKTAYVEWKNLIPNGNILIGYIPTPSWGFIEKVWNYRPIEKTFLDMRSLGASTDLGLHIRGKFDAEGTVSYSLMIGNGSGQKPENNREKKVYAEIIGKPIENVILEGYFDYEQASQGKNKTTLRGLVAYQSEIFTAGMEVGEQIQTKAGVNNADKIPFNITFFAYAPVMDELSVFGRYDYYNPDTESESAGYYENFITLGFDYLLTRDLHLMPNIWMNSFSKKSSSVPSKKDDVVVRLTVYFMFK